MLSTRADASGRSFSEKARCVFFARLKRPELKIYPSSSADVPVRTGPKLDFS
jgi:hypothetical protein